MAKVAPVEDHFQEWLKDLKESFWGDIYRRTKLAWKTFFDAESEQAPDSWCAAARYARGVEKRVGYRNGYYERDFVTRFGTIRLRIVECVRR
jgi:hypothetical protein